MEEKDFLGKVFEILGISAEGQAEIRQKFAEILTAKFLEVFVNELPENKKEEFINLLKEADQDKERISQWLKSENISLSAEAGERINKVFKETTDEIMKILVQDINEEEKQKLLSLIEK